MLNQFVIVLHRPRQVVNIGGVVRAMKNMGFTRLRLVDPVPFDPLDVTGIAHRSEDILAAMCIYDTLDDALADTVYVVGTTDHAQGQHPICSDVRSGTRDLLKHTADGHIALLFGSEDNGLDTYALDRCHTVIRLPTDPAYPSLNLAQAALLLMYELRMAAGSETGLPVPAPVSPPPATTAQLETLFDAWQAALQAIEFFKTPHTDSIMRPLRAVIHRATPDEREAALFTAIAREVVKFVRRRTKD